MNIDKMFNWQQERTLYVVYQILKIHEKWRIAVHADPSLPKSSKQLKWKHSHQFVNLIFVQ